MSETNAPRIKTLMSKKTLKNRCQKLPFQNMSITFV